MNEQDRAFRPIYYLGYKGDFIGPIQQAIDEVDPSGGRLCDLFAGTGSVAVALGQRREVTTVDVQEYSRVLCSAVLSPTALSTQDVLSLTETIARRRYTLVVIEALGPLIDYERECIANASQDPAPLVELLEAGPLLIQHDSRPLSDRLAALRTGAQERLRALSLWPSPDSTVLRHFGGVYFSFPQAITLDGILAHAAEELPERRDTIKAAALSVASQLVNTVGKQFAQPLRPRTKCGQTKSTLARIVQRDRSIDAMQCFRNWLSRYGTLPPATGTPKTLRCEFEDALRSGAGRYSVCYADPPYTRDHYSRFYHVLETMCLRDEPSVSRVTKNGGVEPSRGYYREQRHQSPFCIRSTAPAAFDSLFRLARGLDIPLVLSYSPHETGDGTHPRVVSMQQVTDIAKAYYRTVNVSAIEGSLHNNFNRADLQLKKRVHAEVLFKCRP